MMVSTRGRYALRVLIDLAENQRDGFVTLKEVASRQEISEKYLESIVKELVRAEVLEGLRGKGGGYRLARAPEDVSVLDVLKLMEGTLAPVACLEERAKPCPRAMSCRTLPLWEGLNKVVTDYLRNFTIRDLMRKDTDGFDYVI
ncbi:MAG: Rrf2 family transcriptional regulator [Oscillospiraceae bacterium]|nr:Rrf2 family transcriptional regulator [Oscillospiraceae bacterium]